MAPSPRSQVFERWLPVAHGLVIMLAVAGCSPLSQPTGLAQPGAGDASGEPVEDEGSPQSTLRPVDGPAAPVAARPDPAGGPAETSGGWLGHGTMSETEIHLLWAGFEPATSYEVHRLERSQVASPGAPDLTESSIVYTGTDTAFIDTTVVPGSRYYYFLVPGGANVGEPLRWTLADAVTDTVAPPPIAGLVADYSGTEVTLTWSQGSDNYEFARYAIRRSVDDGDSEYYGTGFSIDQTSFVDDLLPPAGSVTYEVRTLDFHGNASEPATVTVDL